MRRHLSKWHRRIGLISLGLLSWLAVTGVMLNHSHALGLDQPIGTPLVARLYGIQAECSSTAWHLQGRWLIDCGDTLLLDTLPLAQTRGPAQGALLWIPGIIAVATREGLLLLTPEGERIEWMSADLLPGRPLRLGLHEGRIVLQTPAGIFAADDDLIQWQSLDAGASVAWAHTAPLDESTLDHARSLAAVRQLSWTKLLQDLHSGRIIGLAGTILADLGAVSIMVLALLGLVMTQGTGRKRRPRAKAPADAARDDTPNA